MARFIAARAIELETFTPQAHVIGIMSDDFDDAIKATEKRGAFITQAYQQVVMRESVAAAVQHYGKLSCLLGIAAAMRNEGGSWELPEQFIQRFGSSRVLRAEHCAHAVLHCLMAQLAGGAQFVGGTGVEIYFGHRMECRR